MHLSGGKDKGMKEPSSEALTMALGSLLSMLHIKVAWNGGGAKDLSGELLV